MTDRKTNKKIKRTHLVVFSICLVLITVIGVTYFLQSEQRESALAYYERQQISLNIENPKTGSNHFVVSKSDLMLLEIHKINATRRTSAGEVSELVYEGVLLRDLLAAYHVDQGDFEQVIIFAVDGYQSIVAAERLYEQDHVYLVFIEDGLPLQDRGQMGDGPYLLVILEDTFSQNWCKYVVEVTVQ